MTAPAPITRAAAGADVDIASCTVCGAAIILDPPGNRDAVDLHVAWHAELDLTDVQLVRNDAGEIIGALVGEHGRTRWVPAE